MLINAFDEKSKQEVCKIYNLRKSWEVIKVLWTPKSTYVDHPDARNLWKWHWLLEHVYLVRLLMGRCGNDVDDRFSALLLTNGEDRYVVMVCSGSRSFTRCYSLGGWVESSTKTNSRKLMAPNKEKQKTVCFWDPIMQINGNSLDKCF